MLRESAQHLSSAHEFDRTELTQASIRVEPMALLLDTHISGMIGFKVVRRARAIDAGVLAVIITAFEERGATSPETAS